MPALPKHSTARLAPLVIFVLATSGLVALGAAGAGIVVPAVPLPASLVRLGALAALLAGTAGVIRACAREPDAEVRRRSVALAFASATTIMILLTLVSLLARGVHPESNLEYSTAPADSAAEGGITSTTAALLPRASSGFGTGLRGAGQRGSAQSGSAARRSGMPASAQPEADGGARDALMRRIGNLLVIGLLLALAIGAAVAAARRRPLAPVEAAPPLLSADDAQAGFRESLSLLAYAGTDPRRQITAAYQRLLARLSAAGAPRRLEEAPHEYLQRVLTPLGVQGRPMHALADLYVLAQFSDHEITQRHRAAASQLLEQALHGLAPVHRASA